MSASNVLKLSLSILLLLSLAWKIAVPRDSQNTLENDLVEFLERNHFNVVVTQRMVDYMPLIQANTASCHLQIARLTPDGSNRDLIQNLTIGADRIFVVFHGRVYKQQPILFTVLSYFWSRFLRELGLAKHITPIIAVAANSSCEAEQLPWADVHGST